VPDAPVDDLALAARPSLRDRKKDATRQAIEDVAWQLFLDRGYDATTVQDIADAANVAPRTFFRYFPTKEAVLYPELDEVLEGLALAFEQRPREEPALVSLVEAMDAISDELGEDRERKHQRFEMLRKAGVPGSSAFVTTRVTGAVEEMVRRRFAGEPDGEIQARLAAGILSVVMTISNEQWLAGGATSNLEDEAKHCFDTVRHLLIGSAAPRDATPHDE
jgi:TetR/AcrR family transcriptional regulator, regulator of mycofactocin system